MSRVLHEWLKMSMASREWFKMSTVLRDRFKMSRAYIPSRTTGPALKCAYSVYRWYFSPSRQHQSLASRTGSAAR